MNALKVFALLAFATVFVDAEECSMDMETVQKMAMECASHDLSFMMQLGELAQKQDVKERTNFVCDHVPKLTDLAMCMIKKVSACVPAEAKPMMKAIPNKDRIIDALNYMCEDRSVVSDQCLANNVLAISQCYQQKITQIVSVISPADNPIKTVCTIIHAEEKCFTENKGTCSDYYISRLVGTVEKLFPKSVCGNVKEIKSDANKNILNSILIHGQPIGGSLQYKPYNVVNA